MEMELKSSSPMSSGLSPPNCASDPEEKEISDDDDDDRNHKHRRRETMSQSSERDPLEQALTQPYRKRNRPFENGQSEVQSEYNFDRGFSKSEKRSTTGVTFSRFPGEHGFGRGRGRDSRFGNFDVTMQMACPGSFPSAMFSGRGLSNVSNAPTASWNSFGLMPAIPNGGVDPMNPLGMPILRPQLNPSLTLGIQRQRCRDFEERGFCLRGDMCPMEHGINRIVVEDVQSLSQFNLPVSLPNAHLLGTSPGSGFVSSASISSSSAINSRGAHGRASKSFVDDVSLNLDGSFLGAANASRADVYDPDQPLWNNDGQEASTQLLGLQPSNFDESEGLMDAGFSDRVVQSSGAATGSQSASSSVWGRLRNSKNKSELKEKFNSSSKPSDYQENRSKESREGSVGTHVNSRLGKQNNVSTFGSKTVGTTSKPQNDVGSNAKKPAQKAQRTLFVNCIPLKDNKKENLLSHFRKFGEVIDIYIPANTERAFVQFSKREEAERALKAPDAVMGSRFVKLWWANRDSIPDGGMSSGNTMSVNSRDKPSAFGSPNAVGQDNLVYTASRVSLSKNPDSLVTAGDDFKPVTANGPKAPPSQKKMENLELLKEELRKKQEMLEQKRNEFRRQLDKLAIAKQATGVKNEVPDGQATKKQKVETSIDVTRDGKCADAVISGSSSLIEMLVDKVSSVESSACHRSKTNSAAALHDPPLNLKQTVRPVATPGIAFHVNRYKLDKRPTVFRIQSPLPASLANVAALRDHFTLFGEMPNVEIEESNEEDSPNASDDSEAMRNCSARISFATRHTAEKAFLNGKSWHGHNLQFIWITSGIPSSSRSSGESSSALRGALALNSEVQSAETMALDSRDALGPSGSHTSLHKILNELPCDSPTSGGGGHSPVGAEEHSVSEAESLDKSVSYIPLETDEPENKDAEVQEETAPDDKRPDKDLKSGATSRSGERQLSKGKIC